MADVAIDRELSLTLWQQSKQRAQAARAGWVERQQHDPEIYAPGSRGRFGERRRFYGPNRARKGWRDSRRGLTATWPPRRGAGQ